MDSSDKVEQLESAYQTDVKSLNHEIEVTVTYLQF